MFEIEKDCFQSEMDCHAFVDSFENGSIDIVFTDPPYWIGGERSIKISNAKQYREKSFYSQLKMGELKTLFSNLFYKMKDNSFLFCMTNRNNREDIKNMLSEIGFDFKNELVWVKIQDFSEGMAMGMHFLNGVEYILYFTKGSLMKINNRMNVFVKCSPERGRTSKPEELYAYFLQPVISKLKNPLVVDIFGGSDPLTRAKLRGLITNCRTHSNVFNKGDESDPANFGKHLRTQTLRKWII